MYIEPRAKQKTDIVNKISMGPLHLTCFFDEINVLIYLYYKFLSLFLFCLQNTIQGFAHGRGFRLDKRPTRSIPSSKNSGAQLLLRSTYVPVVLSNQI